MRKIAIGFTAALTVTLGALSQAGVATAAGTWTNPSCTTVSGPGGLTYTTNDGATLTATDTTSVPITYVHALTALTDVTNTLIAVREYTDPATHASTHTVLRSTNAGCSWAALGTLPAGGFFHATAGPGGRAYLWSEGGESGVYRVRNGIITQLTDPTPAGVVRDVVVDPANGLHVELADSAGQLYQSYDGGASWATRGTAPAGLGTYDAYDVSIDARDLNHAVVGASGKGAFVTVNGGSSWTSATGLDVTPAGPFGVNVFSLSVSPINHNIVWAEGLDIDESDARVPSQGRHVYRSTNGGRSFSVVVDGSVDVTLPNGSTLWPSPVDANVVYFEFGSNFQGQGTDLYRFSAATGVVTKTHNDEHEITAVAFNPSYPGTLYLGLAKEPGIG